jgi:hypothetical protein
MDGRDPTVRVWRRKRLELFDRGTHWRQDIRPEDRILRNNGNRAVAAAGARRFPGDARSLASWRPH